MAAASDFDTNLQVAYLVDLKQSMMGYSLTKVENKRAAEAEVVRKASEANMQVTYSVIISLKSSC